MDSIVFFAVIGAAALHAGWNGMIKSGLDRQAAMTQLAAFYGLLVLPVLAFLPMPPLSIWPWLLLTGCLHVGYNLFLARAYGLGDLGQIYPLARGVAPLIVTIFSIIIWGEHLSFLTLLAIMLVCGGVLLMAFRGGRRGELNIMASHAVLTALVTSCFIAGYTLVDAHGARLVQDAVGYGVSFVLWGFVMQGMMMVVHAAIFGGQARLANACTKPLQGLFAAGMSVGAYAIAVWAFTKAPVAMVATLRESSILFALLIGAIFMGELPGKGRIMSAIIILTGLILFKF